MDINTKINLENNIYICLNLKDNKLDYNLEYDKTNYEDPCNKFNVYKKDDNGLFKYNNIFYERIKYKYFQKNIPLNEGSYLFIFNKTKLFIEFVNNKISYEMEDINIEELPDLR